MAALILAPPVGAADRWPAGQPLTGVLPPFKINPNKTVVYKRPPIPFQPLSFIDRSTKKPVDPKTIMTTPNGRKVTVGDYLGALNNLERELNKLGHSLRDDTGRDPRTRERTLELQANPVNAALLNQQATNILKDFLPSPTSMNFQTELGKIQSFDKQLLDEIRLIPQIRSRGLDEPLSREERTQFQSEREQTIKGHVRMGQLESAREFGVEDLIETEPVATAQEPSVVVREEKSEQQVVARGLDPLSPADQEALAKWRDTRGVMETLAVEETRQAVIAPEVKARGLDSAAIQRELAQLRQEKAATMGFPTTLPRIPPKPANPKEVHKSKTWNWNEGDADSFAASINGKATLDGYSTMATVHADGRVRASILGSSFTLLDADGTVTAPVSGDMSAKLLVKAVGATIFNLNKKQIDAWSESDKVEVTLLDFSQSYTTIIPPGIPVTAKIGFKGSAGIQYAIGFYPVKAHASIGPFVDTKAYGQAGIGGAVSIPGLDLVDVSAGVSSTLTLVNDSLMAHGELAIKPVYDKFAQTWTWKYPYTFSVLNEMNLLNGKFQLYARAKFWCVNFNVFPPDFDSKCGETYTYTLFKWPGLKYTGYLVSETGSLNL
jgi:hypothetical protein